MEFRFGLDDLDTLAASFWKEAGDAKVFAFHGEMGAGKTTVITALCRWLGVEDVTSSPTFSIINEYAIAPVKGGGTVFHIDLYRLKDDQEVQQAGVEDCVFSGNICMVEWPEKAMYLFEEDAVHVFIETLGEKERLLHIKMPSSPQV